jgi:predicted nuclease of predicted toxin-antitoxin system
MKFLLDECLDYPLASFLKSFGHDATAIAHDYPNGLEDLAVLTIAKVEKRILVTDDKDFGELIFRDHIPHFGVILFRLQDESLSLKQKYLKRVITQYANHLHDFIVVTDRRIRIRATSKKQAA